VSPHRLHSPLAYSYHSHRPVATIFWLLDKPWWYYMLAICVFAVKQAPVVLVPMAIGWAIDGLTPKPPAQPEFIFLNPWVVAGVLFVLIQNIPTNFLYFRMMIPLVRSLTYRIRAAMVRRLQQLSISFHDETEGGRLQSKLLRDVDVIEGTFWMSFEAILGSAFSLAVPLAVTLAKDPIMAIVYAVIIPLAIVLQRGFSRPISRRFEEFRHAVEAMSARATQMIEMIPVTRAHAVENEEVEVMGGHLDHVYRRGLRADYTNALFNACVWVSMQLPMVACLAMASYLAYKGKISTGMVATYTMFFGSISASAQMLLAMVPGLARGADAIRSIGEVLECPDIEENEDKAEVTAVDGHLQFEDVTFTYPTGDRPAIADFNLDITTGECVAFVGESGGGKSTLMNLAIGFHRPSSGRMMLDGVDMETLDLRTYRQFIAVVPQHTLMLAGSIRENILYGLVGATEEKLREVIEAANVAEFVDKLPDGLDTAVGEHGAKLSGGQRQRIAVARALIRDPRIIILDEATSALDVISEALVQEAIDHLVADRTTLIVAHRLSTVRKADRIVVLKDGRCIECDSPANLLEAGGEFSRLHRLQQMLL
jgi:ATP-binding cassette, subfamily B, bacterial